jgi:hypothetical protein
MNPNCFEPDDNPRRKPILAAIRTQNQAAILSISASLKKPAPPQPGIFFNSSMHYTLRHHTNSIQIHCKL